jgi:hypothetical protein
MQSGELFGAKAASSGPSVIRSSGRMFVAERMREPDRRCWMMRRPRGGRAVQAIYATQMAEVNKAPRSSILVGNPGVCTSAERSRPLRRGEGDRVVARGTVGSADLPVPPRYVEADRLPASRSATSSRAWSCGTRAFGRMGRRGLAEHKIVLARGIDSLAKAYRISIGPRPQPAPDPAIEMHAVAPPRAEVGSPRLARAMSRQMVDIRLGREVVNDAAGARFRL